MRGRAATTVRLLFVESPLTRIRASLEFDLSPQAGRGDFRRLRRSSCYNYVFACSSNAFSDTAAISRSALRSAPEEAITHMPDVTAER
ncbi:hypothetical protein ACVIGB_004142 [Bradyrhizobium sp. USDA 4341]